MMTVRLAAVDELAKDTNKIIWGERLVLLRRLLPCWPWNFARPSYTEMTDEHFFFRNLVLLHLQMNSLHSVFAAEGAPK